jgi:2-C-methyl-D-erythritol 4-phosphate cytidylyltransferase
MDGERRQLGVIVVAAGRATRMGGVDKLFAPLGGRPVLGHALRAFARHPAVAALVVVAGEERLAAVTELATAEAGAKLAGVVPGGPRRQDSVRAGVMALGRHELVAIHDGARPFVPAALIDRGVAALADQVAAVAVVPVSDTIKRVDATGRVVETPPRGDLRAAQTPQFFRLAVLHAAYAAADWTREYTDEAGLVEAAGVAVGTFAGDLANIKITTPRDLALAEALWRLGEAPA